MKEHKKEMVGGIFLIAIGFLVFAAQFSVVPNFGLLFLPLLGLAFIVWAIITREDGLMIPGGILSGIGWGVVAMNSNLLPVTGDNEGGVFLIIFGLGFASITLLTALFTDETHWWALIPGAILTLIGIAVLTNGALLNMVALVGTYWPIALIVVGLYVIYKAVRHEVPAEKYTKEKYP